MQSWQALFPFVAEMHVTTDALLCGSGREFCERFCLAEGTPGFLSVFAAPNSLAFSFGVPARRLRAVGFRCCFGLFLGG
jgi:hypothetical protein